MNREQRRAFVRDVQKKGISKGAAEAYLAAREVGINPETASFAKDFSEGDKVRLDVEKITKQKSYESKAQAYKDFVESNADTVFEIGPSRGNLCTLKETSFVFYSGDLLPYEKEGDKSSTE